MQKTQFIFVGILFFLLQGGFMWAQKVVSTSFDSNRANHYKGRIDDINDVTLTLYCKKNICEGELTYLRSKDKFIVKGTLKENRLQLKEYNRANKCSGYLNGKIEGKTIQLNWANKAGTIGNTIQLKEVGRLPDFPTFCGDNKWINAYSGIIGGEAVSMILQRVDNHRILGHAHYTHRKKKILVEGTLSENNNLHLTFRQENTAETIGSLRGVFKQNHNLSATFYDLHQHQKFGTFQLTKSLAMNCLEYADYYTSYDFLFPKSDHAIFNEVMVMLTKDWIGDCRTNAQKIRKKIPAVDIRANQRASGWTDIVLLTDEFISGMLTYHATWTKRESTKTFNFDLKGGNPIELSDIFKKNFDYNAFVKKYAAEAIIKNPVYKRNKDFRNWIKNQEFSFFTLDKEGISFYTDFHIIYDRQRIVIPYKKLKGNIRKNSPVRQLF